MVRIHLKTDEGIQLMNLFKLFTHVKKNQIILRFHLIKNLLLFKDIIKLENSLKLF